MNATKLLAHFERLAEAPDAVPRLRRFILDLAVRGKLVAQDAGDEPAVELLKRLTVGQKKATKNLAVATKSETSKRPAGWVFARFSDVFTLQYGDNLPAEKRSNSGEFPVYGSNGIVGSHHEAFVLEPCIVVGRKGSAGALNLCMSKGSCITDVAYYCVPPIGVDLQYTFKMFQTLGLDVLGKGVKPGLSRAEAYELWVPIPPRAEQHRIVAKVDELMALCDQLEAAQQERERRRDRLAAASLQRLNQPAADTRPEAQREYARFHLHHLPRLTARPEHIKEMRQLFLDLAVRGKLLSQDTNDEPASELIRKIQLERLKRQKSARKSVAELPDVDLTSVSFDLPSGWAWARFPEVGTFGRGKSKHRPRNDPSLFDGGTHLLVQTGDVARSKGVIKTFTSKYNDTGLAQSMKWPAGTLCITIAANIADSGILSFDACFPDSVVGFKASPFFESARYFEYFVRTAKANLLEFAPATAQKNINLEILNAVLIPLPPLAEQRRIVAKVDELMALCDQLEAELTTTQTDGRRLLEAVLEAALAPA